METVGKVLRERRKRIGIAFYLFSAFCMMPICSDHLRKRRRKKNKWEKICDSCEDKFLFDAYMKLEIKAE